MRVRRTLALLTTAGLLPLGLPAGAQAAGPPGGLTAFGYHFPNDWLTELSISADGRYVAFTSQADNLVPDIHGDTNGVADVFVRDIKAKRTILVSATASGNPGSAVSSAPTISDNGRYVAFLSRAKDLVAGTAAPDTTMFVRDVVARTTRLVALPAVPVITWVDTPAISGDGRFVTYVVRSPFSEVAYLNQQVFRTELATGQVSLVSSTSGGVMGDDGSENPAISDDGNLIVFASAAPNLNAGTQGGFWIYLKNMTTGAVRQVGTSLFGASPGNAPTIRTAISGRGDDLAYERLADGYDWASTVFRGPIIAVDLSRGGERELGVSPDITVSGTALHPSLSEHGIDLVFDSDTADQVATGPHGRQSNVFHTDLRPGGITTLVAANAESPSISDSGRYVAYATYTDAIHIWRRDLHSGATLQVDVS